MGPPFSLQRAFFLLQSFIHVCFQSKRLQTHLSQRLRYPDNCFKLSYSDWDRASFICFLFFATRATSHEDVLIFQLLSCKFRYTWSTFSSAVIYIFLQKAQAQVSLHTLIRL